VFVESYVDFLPLADITDQSGQPQKSDEAEKLGEPQDAESSAGV
jgi:hypothetical protein